MKRVLASLGLVVALLLGVSTSAQAQATVNSTTLAAAVTSINALAVQVTSSTTFAVGQFLYVDREMMRITSITRTPIIDVQRGVNGTRADLHANATLLWSGPSNYFYDNEVAGPCTATNETALPHIVRMTGNVYDCKGATATTQVWARYAIGGINQFAAGFLGGPAGVPPTYTSSGAITVQPGVVFIGSGGALAMTLAAPTTAQNGMIMIILASTAQAHTVTNTAGFGGGTTSRDVGTFGGAINDGLTIVAVNGVWWVINTRNVTLA